MPCIAINISLHWLKTAYVEQVDLAYWVDSRLEYSTSQNAPLKQKSNAEPNCLFDVSLK